MIPGKEKGAPRHTGKAVVISSRKGIALLLVLWVLTLMMVIVLSFSFMARTETHSILSFREGIENKFLAEGGIERGIMEIFYKKTYGTQEVALEGLEAWKTDGTEYSDQIGDGYYSVMVMDESGKIAINTLTDLSGIIFKNLLLNSGVKDETADTIVDSLLDWKDPSGGEMHRLHGAGNDYYMSLPNPYQVKNANFDTVEELLLVKGMTPEILYGNGEQRGIIDFITVHSKTAAINFTVAPREVLMAIPGVTPEIADQIISIRESNPKDLAGISALFANITPPFNSFVTAGGIGNTYTIDAVGYKDDEKSGYGIRATVTIDSNNKFTYVYYKSPATLKQ